ncbi:Crp/Fnr family transcriptional regulator [bacterium (Candidatus Blackallbacteria) CG17_big_fil_post_rev_8_21_14_2_50_48_46]|uniref:Crp/Fnr family transcriptional regulator n=1 Tax=bacterium (Candidatus Blackallbacteria) CG17_big_fil_post_rev_8_21_14_2_50_48_46 TaxID=2014261 RepID=A0A2M7GBZ3_9BACT|nr:MAG: cyclic nucleotide-binding protein [bacterium (Candidatus Blackallbacteria) CG18_big_fil_WC_8_21_14_2_50_49_26]PIW19670.1 MAG: Crp/Fnr family transcriptional regulator [bacterium (Candidatus Blackallbacteria) CG17_big_fil_post_rev_8_21_14_2_50_48_46]PIW44743.1 MAG: Crp/Fnr family transcriptional regulator [bacterium (Candidatus Blackallbacteria) CG13_big_fil_rev_8_21_14_2_50_49_14]
MNLEKLATFFAEGTLFNNLSREELNQLAQIARERKFDRGQVIFYEGDLGGSLYIIVTGSVKIVIMSDDGREHILGLLHEGDFFGEVSLIDGEPRSATAIALENVNVVMISRDDFIRLLRENPEMSLKIMVTLCERLRKTDKHVESLAFLSAPGRVAQVLLNLAETHASGQDKNITVSHKITRQEFASLAGTSRETLTRVLMDFQDDGLIKLEKNKIHIYDRLHLKEKVV